jgi:hypothetical protein
MDSHQAVPIEFKAFGHQWKFTAMVVYHDGSRNKDGSCGHYTTIVALGDASFYHLDDNKEPQPISEKTLRLWCRDGVTGTGGRSFIQSGYYTHADRTIATTASAPPTMRSDGVISGTTPMRVDPVVSSHQRNTDCSKSPPTKGHDRRRRLQPRALSCQQQPNLFGTAAHMPGQFNSQAIATMVSPTVKVTKDAAGDIPKADTHNEKAGNRCQTCSGIPWRGPLKPLERVECIPMGGKDNVFLLRVFSDFSDFALSRTSDGRDTDTNEETNGAEDMYKAKAKLKRPHAKKNYVGTTEIGDGFLWKHPPVGVSLYPTDIGSLEDHHRKALYIASMEGRPIGRNATSAFQISKAISPPFRKSSFSNARPQAPGWKDERDAYMAFSMMIYEAVGGAFQRYTSTCAGTTYQCARVGPCNGV